MLCSLLLPSLQPCQSSVYDVRQVYIHISKHVDEDTEPQSTRSSFHGACMSYMILRWTQRTRVSNIFSALLLFLLSYFYPISLSFSHLMFLPPANFIRTQRQLYSSIGSKKFWLRTLTTILVIFKCIEQFFFFVCNLSNSLFLSRYLRKTVNITTVNSIHM